jgi:two-component system chemotaxis response regulator CheB
MGAVDFVIKPSTTDESESIAALKGALVHRIHHVSSLRLLGRYAPVNTLKPSTVFSGIDNLEKNEQFRKANIKAIEIGISTGGPKALVEMLPVLCSKVSLPVFIIQHMPENFTRSLAESLGRKCSHVVKEGVDGETVTGKTVYIAPGGRHMLLQRSGANTIICINDQPPENNCRPSIDAFFRSIPSAYKGDTIAIIMTGMGSDGTKSIRALKREGTFIIAQDEQTSIVWGMPGSAVATGLVDTVTPLMKIPDVVIDYINRRNT